MSGDPEAPVSEGFESTNDAATASSEYTKARQRKLEISQGMSGKHQAVNANRKLQNNHACNCFQIFFSSFEVKTNYGFKISFIVSGYAVRTKYCLLLVYFHF